MVLDFSFARELCRELFAYFTVAGDLDFSEVECVHG